MAETILIVDDEDLVRWTFCEWLRDADQDCELLEARDAESALRIASQRPIDLAILDWNLGAGNNGLQLLEDLRVFWPDVVAILVTGYAQQATPLDALRMGVRDYLDKNRDLRRETFLDVVRKQLAWIRPAKRERQHLERVRQFRQAVESVLPLVQTTSQLASGVSTTETLRALLQLAKDIFQSDQGVLILRHVAGEAETGSPATGQRRADAGSSAGNVADFPRPVVELFDLDGQKLPYRLDVFGDTVAATVLAMQEICIVKNLREDESLRGVHLQPYEMEHSNMVAMPLPLEPPGAAVLEIFDTPLATSALTATQRTYLTHFQSLARAVLEQLLAERQLHAALWRALQAAAVSASGDSKVEASIMSEWKRVIGQPALLPNNPEELVQLAEKLRQLFHRFGLPAVQFCQQLLEQVERLLDGILEPPQGKLGH